MHACHKSPCILQSPIAQKLPPGRDARHRSCLPPQSIDPTLLLTAFLPILLFAGAFALEWHTMRRLMWSSLLLAGARQTWQPM